MNATNEERDVTQHCFDPFPEPQTIPAGWDTSTLLSAPVIASAQQAQDSTENESN
jgi:hypothetical protein